jgi:flagellar biosynthesis protein FliR
MTLSVTWFTTLFFIAIRLSVLMLFTPIQAFRQLPLHVRLLFVFMISLLTAAQIPTVPYSANSSRLILEGMAEFAIGLTLSLAIYAAFAVFQIAGQLIDIQIGMQALTVFNPSEHGQEPETGRLLSLLATWIFFATNGHHYFIRGVAYSFLTYPPGSFHFSGGLKPILDQFGHMFVFALLLASPVIIGVLAIDCAFALLTRNMPQISPYFLALPIKILLGFLLFNLALPGVQAIAMTVFQNCLFLTFK